MYNYLLLDIVVIFVNNCNKCPRYILCLFVTMILMYTLIYITSTNSIELVTSQHIVRSFPNIDVFLWPSILFAMTIGHWPTCGGVQSGNDSTRSENQSNWCPNQNFNAMVTNRILTKARPGRSPFVYVRLSPAYFPFSRASSYWHIRGRPYIT